MSEKLSKYFLPYQEAWIKDQSRFKIVEKSRRTGFTYAQSYEDVHDCVTLNFPPNGKPNVYFSSADESAALEYVAYCEQWAMMFDVAARSIGEVVLDSKNDVKAFVIEFANGAKIHALRSNPRAFRSKGGKVVLDEFAFHDNPDLLWKAAQPCITWGYSFRVLSTHNGKNQRYYRLVNDAKNNPRTIWSLHRTTIEDAVNQGLVEKIKGLDRAATAEEKARFIEECREMAGDDETFMQEYMCEPVDEATAFLTYEEIEGIESPLASIDYDPKLFEGNLYLGMDIGRRRHLSVLWLIEELGDVYWTRIVKIMERRPFREQREELYRMLKFPHMQRACIDDTGLGMQLAEEAQEAFGTYRVEAVTFTPAVKMELASQLRPRVEEKRHRIPSGRDIREDLHSVRKIVTKAGNIRLDAVATDLGHADRFWALALANHAAENPSGPVEYKAIKHRHMSKVVGTW